MALEAGGCHSGRAKGRKITTLRGSIVQGQLKFEAGSAESPSPSISYQLITTPHCRRRSLPKLGGFVGLPQSTTTTSVDHPPHDHPSTNLLWHLGLRFSLSQPSIFIRGAVAPLIADPTTTLTADRDRYRSAVEHRSLAACGFRFALRAAERTRAAAECSHDIRPVERRGK